MEEEGLCHVFRLFFVCAGIGGGNFGTFVWKIVLGDSGELRSFQIKVTIIRDIINLSSIIIYYTIFLLNDGNFFFDQIFIHS